MNTYLTFPNLEEQTGENKFKWLSNQCESAGIDSKISSIIDLGCGHGQNSIALTHHFKNVYGIDPSSEMISFATGLKEEAEKWYDLSGLSFQLGDFETIPFRDVDIICLINSIHFSSKIHEDLVRILSRIRTGGLLYISEPGDKSKYGSGLMANEEELQKKRKVVIGVRRMLLIFLNFCNEENKGKPIFFKHTPNSFSFIMQKI